MPRQLEGGEAWKSGNKRRKGGEGDEERVAGGRERGIKREKAWRERGEESNCGTERVWQRKRRETNHPPSFAVIGLDWKRSCKIVAVRIELKESPIPTKPSTIYPFKK